MMPRKMMLTGLLASLVVLALLIVPQYVVPEPAQAGWGPAQGARRSAAPS